jgi:hypothetical protein
MKTKALIFIFAMLFGIFSCNKEHNNGSIEQPSVFDYQLSSTIPYGEISKRDKGFNGKNGSNELLVFSNMNAIILTINDLERQMIELDSVFFATFYHLTDDERNEKEIELNFVSEKPILDFNDFFLYYSLYQEIAHQENLWLQNEELDHETDPDNDYIIEYEVRAVLNTDYEVQIADSIYKFTENGYFSFPAATLKTLQLLDDYLDLENLPEGVNFDGQYDDFDFKSSTCSSNRRNNGYKVNPNNSHRRIKWVVSHWTHPWERSVVAKTKNYKKQGNSWKKYSTYCEARVYGHISDANGHCATQVQFNGPHTKTATAKKVKHKIYVQTKTKSGWVKADLKGADNTTHIKSLTW